MVLFLLHDARYRARVGAGVSGDRGDGICRLVLPQAPGKRPGRVGLSWVPSELDPALHFDPAGWLINNSKSADKNGGGRRVVPSRPHHHRLSGPCFPDIGSAGAGG